APAAPSTPGPIPRGSARRVIGAPTAGPPGRSGAPLYWPPEARTTAAPPLLPRTSGEGAPGAVPAPPHPGSEARMLHTTPQERLALGGVSLLLLAGASARWLPAERPPAAAVDSATGAADTATRGTLASDHTAGAARPRRGLPAPAGGRGRPLAAGGAPSGRVGGIRDRGGRYAHPGRVRAAERGDRAGAGPRARAEHAPGARGAD